MAICFISGGYALYTNVLTDIADVPASNVILPDSTNPNSETLLNNEIPTASDIKNALELTSNIFEATSSVSPYLNAYSAVNPTHNISVFPDFDLTNYTVSNSDYFSFYAPEGYDTTDKFSQCAECGKYFSYGVVTKALPDYAICRGHTDSMGSVMDVNNPWILSYDEVMYFLEHDKAPESVYNRVHNHYGGFVNYASYEDYLAGITQDTEEIHIDAVSVNPHLTVIANEYHDVDPSFYHPETEDKEISEYNDVEPQSGSSTIDAVVYT